MNLLDKTFVNSDGEVVEYDGSKVVWRVSAYSIITREKSIFLINSIDEKLYDVPGGNIELTETIEEALKREAMEEAGLIIHPRQVIGCHQDYFYHRFEKKFYKTLLLYFESDLIDRKKPTEDTIQFADFVLIKELDTLPIMPYLQRIIVDYLGKSYET